jgi:hypothetical protein
VAAGHAEGHPGGLAVPRVEASPVNAVGHHPDPGRVGAVELHELARLGRGGRQQAVGGGGHPLLPGQSGGRLRSVAVGQAQVLDPAEGVERVDHGAVPPLPGQPRDPARHPVVAVDDVVGAVALPRAQQRAEEGAQVAGQELLGDRLRRSRRQVQQAHPGPQLDHRRVVGRGGPRVEVGLDPGLGQLAGEGEDGDVHAAGVADAGRSQRRGVHRQHRNPPDRPVPACRHPDLPPWARAPRP